MISQKSRCWLTLAFCLQQSWSGVLYRSSTAANQRSTCLRWRQLCTSTESLTGRCKITTKGLKSPSCLFRRFRLFSKDNTEAFPALRCVTLVCLPRSKEVFIRVSSTDAVRSSEHRETGCPCVCFYGCNKVLSDGRFSGARICILSVWVSRDELGGTDCEAA